MTLTAFDKDFDLFNPALALESGLGILDLLDFVDRQNQAGGFFCPHCYRSKGEMIPVRFRNSESRRVHFFHIDGEASSCSKYTGMGEKHLLAQYAVYDDCRGQSGAQASVEARILTENKDLVIPDVLVEFNLLGEDGQLQRMAHEIQVQHIGVNGERGLEERTNRLHQAGMTHVYWYLAGSNWSESNRRWCWATPGVSALHLTFRKDDEESLRPQWQSDDGFFSASISRHGNSADDCSKKNETMIFRLPRSIDELREGSKVTGVSGRISHGWHGIIKRIEIMANGKSYYWVFWDERRDHKESIVSRTPIIGHSADQLAIRS